MKLAVILAVLLLTGCSGMSDDEVRAASRECRDKDGTPVPMAHLDGRIAEVRCL